MPPLPPTKPGESGEAYRRRITAAEGVPMSEPVVVYQEHGFWRGAADVVKRYQTMVGLIGIVVATAITTTKANKIIDEVAAAGVKLKKLDDVVTEAQMRNAIDDKIGALALQCSKLSTKEVLDLLKSKHFVLRGPNYFTRSQPYESRIIDVRETTRE